MSRITLVTIALTVFLTQAASSQDTGLPPLGADAIQHLDNIVSKYDKFTDKSKIELAIQVRGTSMNGMFLTVFCVYSGRVVPVNAKAYIGLAVIGDAYKFEENNKIILLIDGNRQVYDPQRFPTRMRTGKVLEFLLIPREFNADQMAAVARAAKVEGRLGGYDEFQLTATQRATLAEFVDKMRGGSEALLSGPTRPIELPSNFSYTRQLGEQTGLPYYTLMPDDEAMASDAKEGKVFQALGVMVQPAMNKFGLALINAQTQYQLHINKTKGAVITLGQEVFRIPEYEIASRKDVGRLKIETAAIKIPYDVFAKLLKSDRVTIQCGSVIYELDQDNIEALKYLGQQIAAEPKPKN
jgi:hypothetical protein